MSDPVLIAHISDLHFGSKNQPSSWQVLEDYIRKNTDIELVLVTGDIVHSPNITFYKEAREKLERLEKRFLVCAGNHDRYMRGIKSLFQKVFQKHDNANFDKEFSDHKVSLDAPQKVTLGSSPKWNLTIFGIDSSLNADFFARGLVSNDDLERLQRIDVANSVDLSFLLVHHHIMSVPELEIAHSNNVRNLANVTSMVNSGRFLERLSEAPVDIVLHGHEHVKYLASYHSHIVNSKVTIVGAGSGTGNDPVKGCQQDKITFNIIALHKNRHVELVTMVYRGGDGWSLKEESFPLFKPTSLRKANFMRRNQSKESRYTRSVRRMHVEFMPNRDVIVRDKYTNWVIKDGIFSVPVENSSGFIEIESVELRTVPCRGGNPKKEVIRIGDNKWQLKYSWDENEDQSFEVLELKYKWQGGGILSDEEMKAFMSEARAYGRFRSKGYEYAGISTRLPLKSIELLVSIPRHFIPIDGMCIMAFNKENNKEVNTHNIEQFFDKLGPNQYKLYVPYPRSNCLYAIAWKPPKSPEPSKIAKEFWKVSDKEGVELVTRFAQKLEEPLKKSTIIALYIPDGADEKGISRFKCVGSCSLDDARKKPKPYISIYRDLETSGVWGGVLLPKDSNHNDSVITIPVRFDTNWENDLPWGLLTLTITSKSEKVKLLIKNEKVLYNMLNKALICLINRAINKE